MNVQEMLSNYNTYKLRVSILEKEINELNNELYTIRSTKLDGMPKPKGYTTSQLEEQIVRIDEKIQNKKRKINELEKELRVTEDLIKILKSYNQDIIIMRYYKKMSIEEIATKKNRGYVAICKTIEKSIKIMQNEYDKNKNYTKII